MDRSSRDGCCTSSADHSDSRESLLFFLFSGGGEESPKTLLILPLIEVMVKGPGRRGFVPLRRIRLSQPMETHSTRRSPVSVLQELVGYEIKRPRYCLFYRAYI